jgi:putative glutamine amidotransferase
MQPRIAIPQPTASDHVYNNLNWRAYADAVRASGGLPIELPVNTASSILEPSLRAVDGFVLPGSPFDVNPQLYGQSHESETSPADPLREQTDRIILEHAFATGKPVLAICFGMQMLNVVCGGTLVQDLMILPINHAAARGVQIAHTVDVDAGSLLAVVAGNSEGVPPGGRLQLPVNSSHHQAVAIPGRGLRVVARSMLDGVVEAIELAELDGLDSRRFMLGVQWHPERTVESNAVSRRLFDKLVEAAARMTQA